MSGYAGPAEAPDPGPPTPVNGQCPFTPPPSKPSFLSSARNQPSIFSPNPAQPGLLTHWAPFPYLLPPGAQDLPIFPLFQTPHPAPTMARAPPGKESPWLRAGQHVPGRGGTSARTSRSLPRAGVGERGIVSRRHSPPVPRSDFVGGPKQWSLRPRPGQAGGSRWCIRGRHVCPSDQVSRRPELQGSVTFSADASPSTYPSGPAARRPAQAPGPDRPGARGPGGEGGLGEGPRRAQAPLPPSLCCSCFTTEEPREVPQPPRSRL